MKPSLVYALLCLLPAACTYRQGVNVTGDQARQFIVGSATIPQIEAKLGPPTSTKTNSDGTSVLEYQYDETRQNAVNYLPVVGLLANKVDESSNLTTFIFDRNGVLSAYSTGKGGSSLTDQ